jgi:beta propeller repeat protein
MGEKMSKKLVPITLLFIFFILASTAASAAQVMKIGKGSQPAIDDGKVVWTDNGIIHLYDLKTKKDITIKSSASSHPAISGSKLVWHNESNKVPILTVYDISSGSKSYIRKNVDKDSIPAIYGSKIVWNANSSIYMRDISKSIQIKIASGSYPDIYGSKVVYSSDIGGDTPQIYLYNIISKKSTDISKYGDNYYPHIYGDKVIWSDFYTRLGNIRMYNTVTKEQIEVTSGDDTTGYDTGGATDISGKNIVYLKHNDLANMDSGDVYVYNIATGKSKQLSSGNTAQTPVISRNTVVWADSGSIYLVSLRKV